MILALRAVKRVSKKEREDRRRERDKDRRAHSENMAHTRKWMNSDWKCIYIRSLSKGSLKRISQKDWRSLANSNPLPNNPSAAPSCPSPPPSLRVNKFKQNNGIQCRARSAARTCRNRWHCEFLAWLHTSKSPKVKNSRCWGFRRTSESGRFSLLKTWTYATWAFSTLFGGAAFAFHTSTAPPWVITAPAPRQRKKCNVTGRQEQTETKRGAWRRAAQAPKLFAFSRILKWENLYRFLKCWVFACHISKEIWKKKVFFFMSSCEMWGLQSRPSGARRQGTNTQYTYMATSCWCKNNRWSDGGAKVMDP